MITTIVIFAGWLVLYDIQVFHGPHEQDWYLLDRLFISFIIYGVFGVLAWMFRDQFEKLIQKNHLIIAVVFIGSFVWTNQELLSFGYPLSLSNAPYYKPSMTIYSLAIIGLIAFLALKHINNNSTALPIFHFLATYAYRAYLSNVFWLQIIWRFGGKNLSGINPILAIVVCYV